MFYLLLDIIYSVIFGVGVYHTLLFLYENSKLMKIVIDDVDNCLEPISIDYQMVIKNPIKIKRKESFRRKIKRGMSKVKELFD